MDNKEVNCLQLIKLCQKLLAKNYKMLVNNHNENTIALYKHITKLKELLNCNSVSDVEYEFCKLVNDSIYNGDFITFINSVYLFTNAII